MNVSHKELERIMLEWRETLKLTDWTIRIEYADSLENDDQAEVSRVPETKSARIKVLRFENWCESEKEFYADALKDKPTFLRELVEPTVVHELLHIIWWFAKENGLAGILNEQAIDCMSYTLVELKYQ